MGYIRRLVVTVTVAIAFTFVAAGIYAGTEVKDEIRMENKAYKKHKESIQTWSHKKHATEYAEKHPDLYASPCGECHHEDKDGKSVPLNDLKEGDEVQNCIECHKIAGYATGKKFKGIPKEKKREYHGNAIHDNCKACHKKFNKKMKLKSKDEGAAPYTCKQCHPKKKKK